MRFSFFSIRQKFNYDNVNFGVDPPPLLEKVQILNFFFLEGFPYQLFSLTLGRFSL